MSRKYLVHISTILAACFLCGGTACSQTYNANSGGYNTGYGTVYGSFGLAQATQNMYNTMQIQMSQSIMRQAMIKRHGRAAVEKAEREAAAGTRPAGGITVAARPAPKNYGKFRPDPTVDTGKTFADALGETPEEKALYKQIVEQTRKAFEAETAAKGWKNNIAGAFTFFIVSTATVYHDTPEPTDATVEALYDAMNRTIDEIPEFAKMSNRDKQALYNTLIGFAGIPLATYSEGKSANHAPTIGLARQLAGKLIEVVLKSSPERFKFENGVMGFS
jgi:hypothetical protein